LNRIVKIGLLSDELVKKSINLHTQYNLALFNSWFQVIESVYPLKESPGKNIQDKFRSIFDIELKHNLVKNSFVQSLAEFLESYAEFASLLFFDLLYNHFENMLNRYDNIVETTRNHVNRAPSDIIPMKGRFEIHHYKTDSTQKFQTPILIVGSLINRYYILDLIPETSIVRYFHELGFDVYATDWCMPQANDKEMLLEIYARDYLENAVEKVKEITKSPSITLFGYCWGGIMSLMYSTLYPENIKNLVLHATPVDFSKSPTLLELWIQNIDIKKFVDVFGNVPSSFLNIAFWLRNPMEAFAKPFFYFRQPRSMNEVKQFLAVEYWLYDSVPIIGNVFKQIIEDIYKKTYLSKTRCCWVQIR